MEKYDIYKDISARTDGDLYIGVVGPVRTGKSTFITKFMEKFVLPNISNKLQKQIATDEMPQSADGKTIMTTQPKFVPANGVKVQFKNKATARVKLVDCVGYFVEGAVGHEEDEKPRLVKTPWDEKEIPFEKAAEIGTKKVIQEYSTIGIVVTTDGSFGEISRENYIVAENRVIDELKSINKPFVIVLNCKNPNSDDALKIARELESKHGVSVCLVNALELTAEDITSVMEKVLLEFPMRGFNLDLPLWMQALPAENKVVAELIEKIKEGSESICKMRDFSAFDDIFSDSEYFNGVSLKELKLGDGMAEYEVQVKNDLFYKILSNECGEDIKDDYSLMSYIKTFSKEKKSYQKIKDALYNAQNDGYGVVLPSIDEMNLEEPVLVKQGGKYGVKLKASAPSLHLIKVDVSTEVSPIVGTEKQGEDLIKYIMNRFEDNPAGIWETNMFGKSLHDLVNEGLAGKLNAMPKDAQGKMQKTLTKMVNENRGGMICILL
ncbi:MAG: stage IV sporulation protein A [Clostridia bacterium]|nr:stage IV sporulation protein A [Clostridia bacterium]